MKKFSVVFSYLIHRSLTLNLRKKQFHGSWDLSLKRKEYIALCKNLIEREERIWVQQ